MVADRPSRATPAELAAMFPDRRAEDATTIRRCQLVMVRMLMILDYICRSEGISYWLTAGTLIGALRHRGFIPWDWDIDIGMTEEDYQAFEKVAHRLPPDIFFQNRTSEPTLDDTVIAAKLRDRYSNYPRWQAENPGLTWHNGLQVDFLVYRKDSLGRLVNPHRGTPYRRDEIFPLTQIEYEGAFLPAPKDPDYYIAVRYGDYMKIPPAGDRVVHEDDGDPFTPCDHPESLSWPGPRPAPQADDPISRLRRLFSRR